MGAVGGVLLDDSVILAGEEGGGNLRLSSGSEILLRRLQFSKLRVGISHQDDVSSDKAIFLKRTAGLYSYDCISLHASHVSDSLNRLLPAWNDNGETCFFVTSRKVDQVLYELQNHGWRIIYISSDNGMATNKANKDFLVIDKLEKLLIALCSFSKKALLSNTSSLIIGYVMKPSREEDFSKRGAFPLYPTQNGLMFIPLSFEIPLAPQMQEIDVVLHKATDEIINIDTDTAFDFPKGISYSKGMCELERYIEDHPRHCMIDPLNKIYPLLDRHMIQQVLLGLQEVSTKDPQRLRAPHFLKVDNFRGPNLEEQLSEAKLSYPVIVKPQVACGVADAHNMALVFKFEDFRNLCVPLPAIVQEYVDHGSLLFKFYVLGAKVFYAVKKSMPNSNVFLSSLSSEAPLNPIIFNSLKSLPVSTEGLPSKDELKADKQYLDVELVNNAAKYLKNKLGLTIFGFDVLIEEDSGEHVIVDLNYFPSFKEVPDSDAIPAFWDAIKSSYESWKAE